MPLPAIARWLLIGGVLLIVLAGLVALSAKLGLPLGRLPGDITIRRENFTFSFPLGTSILVSIVLTVLINLALRFLNR